MMCYDVLKNFVGFGREDFVIELLPKSIKMRGTAIKDGG